MYVCFLYACMNVCESVSTCVCVCVWVVLFALACWLLLSLLPPRCSGFRFTRQQSALPLPLPLLRPRPLPPPLLPSYSCVAFFLTFAEFIDIFSICFCALLSLSERALSLFLPLSLSLFRSFAHSLTHTQTLVFLLFSVENNLQFYLIALLSLSLLHTRTHTNRRTFDSCCCFFLYTA